MSEKQTSTKNGIEVDVNVCLRLRSKILSLEKSNLKTKEKNQKEMIEALKKMIEEAVE